MGSVGDCFANAMCESFFASLECELIDRSHWRTHSDAGMAVFDYIECFYNPRRRHSALAYLNPAEFEEESPKPDDRCPDNSLDGRYSFTLPAALKTFVKQSAHGTTGARTFGDTLGAWPNKLRVRRNGQARHRGSLGRGAI